LEIEVIEGKSLRALSGSVSERRKLDDAAEDGFEQQALAAELVDNSAASSARSGGFLMAGD
jgi:hypothetical protein